jgi:hypothetical protein
MATDIGATGNPDSIELSCFRRGRKASKGKPAVPRNYFAVPNENYADGEVTAIKLFREILEKMKADPSRTSRNHLNPAGIFQDMAKAMDEKFDGSRRGAGTAFAWLLSEAVLFLARKGNFEVWLDAKLAEAESYAIRDSIRRKKEGAAFTERMKAAREAKRKASAATTSASMEVSHA